MSPASLWVRFVSGLVPADVRAEWVEEWNAELVSRHGSMTYAWGALADAWYLRTEGWTMDAMVRDVRTAVRGLTRSPFFTVLSGLTLAVGIAANTAIFSVVDGVLINPLPFPEAERLVSYNHEAPGLGVNVPLIPHSQAMFVHYEANARELESLAVVTNTNVSLLTEGSDPQQLSAAIVTRRYFDVMGVQPMIGRGFVEGEDREGAEPVVVLGYALWEQTFGADPSVLGELVELDGTRRRVVGVMPEGFTVLDEELWFPLPIDPETPQAGSLSLIGIGRLAEGATPESADTEMEQLLFRLAEEQAESLPAGILEQAGMTADVKPLKEVVVEDVRKVLWVLLGTVGIVLLVACANVANLFLVRAEGRQREQALRTALGAGRMEIARQYLTESVVLALAAGALGLVLAEAGVRGLLALAPADLPQALSIGIDGSVVVFTALISVAAGILFGIIPALGVKSRELSHALKDGGRSSTGGKERMRARNGLVVAQVAMALVLLVGSGLMLRSFVALKQVDPGFETAGLMTFSLGLPEVEYEDAGSALAFHRQLTDRLATMGGVQSVGMINGLPLTDAKSAGPMEPLDRPFPEDELGPMIERRRITPGYLETMSIPIVEGRGLEWTDRADGVRAVVVSEALARTFWPDESAIGKSIRSQGDENDAWEVVGVAADVRFDGVTDEPLPMTYEPMISGNAESTAATLGVDVVVKVSGDPLESIAPLQGRAPLDRSPPAHDQPAHGRLDRRGLDGRGVVHGRPARHRRGGSRSCSARWGSTEWSRTS